MKLHEELMELIKRERVLSNQIIEKLQLMEVGKYYLKLGHSSLFDYMVRGLGYSESAAYQKQACVRLAREIPEVKSKLNSGALTASGLSMAFKTLRFKSTEEKKQILQQIENKPSRQIKEILQPLAPTPQPVQVQKTEYNDKVVIRLELSKKQNQNLEKLGALSSHQGDLGSLFEKLINQELKKFENAKFKTTKSKNPRAISRTLRNYVFKKAKYQCEYPGCGSSYYLQVDHKIPVSKGGHAGPENLQTLCSAHNRFKGASLTQSFPCKGLLEQSESEGSSDIRESSLALGAAYV